MQGYPVPLFACCCQLKKLIQEPENQLLFAAQKSLRMKNYAPRKINNSGMGKDVGVSRFQIGQGLKTGIAKILPSLWFEMQNMSGGLWRKTMQQVLFSKQIARFFCPTGISPRQRLGWIGTAFLKNAA